MAFDIDALRVRPGSKVDLSEVDPKSTPEWKADDDKAANRAAADARLLELNEEIEALQELLYAEGKQRVLVVLQAMDAGGKDGTIRKVFEGVNPQGVKIPSFKKPTKPELARDYLWRVHAHVPADGEIVVFNRSHYEDVLVVRVLDLVPKERWSKRYDHIVDFEEMLADEGTTIIKIFLHISKDEQKERLQARLDEPEKNWKFEPADLDARSMWDDYMEAFEDALSKTSTKQAPWYIIPANRKWYRNIAVSEIVKQTLASLQMEFPPAHPDILNISIPD